MKTLKLFLASLLILTIIGCARIDPFSPKNKQAIQNQGTIEELKTNQNSMVADMLKLRQDQTIVARDMDKVVTGIGNKQNTGVQLFQGDGALLAIVTLAGMLIAAGVFASYFKTQAVKNEKTANILATEIALQNDQELNDRVCLAAMHTEVEDKVYHMLVRSQKMLRH